MNFGIQAVVITLSLLLFSSECGVNAVVCGGRLTTQGNFSSPNYPLPYTNNATCLWTLTAAPTKNIQLRIGAFNTETSFDYFAVYNGLSVTNVSAYAYRYSGHFTPFTLLLGNNATVIFTSDSTVVDTGFYVEFTSGCGGTLSVQGTLSSPNYFLPYPNSAYCVWTLVTAPGRNIQLTFNPFNTEPGYDFLTVYNGTYVQYLTPYTYRFSGHLLPFNLVLGSYATLVFTSDNTVVDTGFSVAFTSSCGGTLSGQANISSPAYPQLYPNNAYCVWKLTATPGKNIQLRFNALSTELSYDYVTIYNGVYVPNVTPYSYRYSGLLPPFNLLLGASATMVFSSDNTITNTGFNVEFASVPIIG